MSNIIVGILWGQIPYLEEHIAQKKCIYGRYKEGFRNLPVWINSFDEKNSDLNFWLSCLTVEIEAMCRRGRGEKDSLYITEKEKRCPDEILEALAAFHVEGRSIWKSMHMQSIYRNNSFVTKDGNGRVGSIACRFDDSGSSSDNGETFATHQFDKKYEVDSILIEDDHMVLNLKECPTLGISSVGEELVLTKDWIKKHKKRFGVEPNLFDGA